MKLFARAAIHAMVAVSFVCISNDTVAAQQDRISSLSVPITGTADAGGRVSGAFRILRFENRGNTVVAVGTASGVFIDPSGAARNIVTQVTMPVDVNATTASRNTDVAIAASSCEALFLQLGTSAFNVLGTNIALDPVALSVATSTQATPVVTTNPAVSSPTTTQANRAFPTLTPIAPITPIMSPTSATSATITAPGTITAPQRVSTRGTATPLGDLLCSATSTNTLRAPAQLVLVLNRILAAL